MKKRTAKIKETAPTGKYETMVIKTTNVYSRNRKAFADTTIDVIVNEGGARSSKSKSLCQLFLFERLLKIPNYKLLIIRKIKHSLKLSTYEMFIDYLKEVKRYDESCHNQSDMIYYFPEMNSSVKFTGLDKIDQEKSTEYDDIWMEEANEFCRKDLSYFKTRLSKGSNNKIVLSYNPEECWIPEALEKGAPQFSIGADSFPFLAFRDFILIFKR